MKHCLLYSPFANLFSEEGDLETQILFGERVLFCNHKCYAYSQLFKDGALWRPYPGNRLCADHMTCFSSIRLEPNAAIVSSSALLKPWNIPLPFGTLLVVDSKNRVRFPKEVLEALVEVWGPGEPWCVSRHLRFLNRDFSMENLFRDAEQFLGFPYLWGGRCLHKNLEVLGVDCSGLINILYQAQGYNIPRNSIDQYADCYPVANFNELPPGGFVFLNEKMSCISHVMLKRDSQRLIHASKTLGNVSNFIVGKDCQFTGNMLHSPRLGINVPAFFGFPKKRRAFL
ncbi:C40 family peptidase [Candidatus Chlamydia sanziniae]|uniref:NLP/P60 family protein n=1 Tax=Candidatus Chlamydia sanziniae TaxID=1806891 RepID=A0A1A9HVJ1_9CHLA|nr:NlpC/P60 family protein [Candidatus Chlamydia sanziniae]ANH78998.1 NLP/P60 family protein [Candidatus Chlamydia sanziniae]